MNAPQTNPEARNPEARNPEALDPDTRIDDALATLRRTQPPTGMEHRLLHALESREAHTAAPRRARTPSQIIPSLPIAAWITAGALALLTVAALFLHHPTSRPQTRPQTVALTTPASRPTFVSPSTQPGAPFIAQPHRAMGGVATPTSRTILSSRPEAHTAAVERPAGRITTTTPTQSPLTPEQLADLADLHAPSHPAPPLPLTPQEQALLRLLRRGNAVELADLIPAVSAARDAQETAAFRAFFPDPPPIPQPTGETE